MAGGARAVPGTMGVTLDKPTQVWGSREQLGEGHWAWGTSGSLPAPGEGTALLGVAGTGTEAGLIREGTAGPG